ncbi:BolA domain UV induced protein Uvi31 [Dispira parvispora]|uniref:BolA domain UV induced protein Uvi31 n=1 Tax=Dispira parvispora TaxID=1520584 RepID=A0A9W8EA92_9FUNG|nr:BolA domain UV induced protein Uvi31 [Dispira parvispora]
MLTKLFRSRPHGLATVTHPSLTLGIASLNRFGNRTMATRSPTSVPGPVELSIRDKLTERFHPVRLYIVNESHKHAHHAPMRGVTSKETHFRVTIVSDEFESLRPLQRHRAVYQTLQSELDAGLHALSLKTHTPAEEANLVED